MVTNPFKHVFEKRKIVSVHEFLATEYDKNQHINVPCVYLQGVLARQDSQQYEIQRLTRELAILQQKLHDQFSTVNREYVRHGNNNLFLNTRD